MKLNCNSCQKKFEVPDSAITDLGRLVQCGSCGNKWTQFPDDKKKTGENKNVANDKIKTPVKTIKKTTRQKKREIKLYSKEYLKKKHGLSINVPNEKPHKNIKSTNSNGFGFYNYLITLIVFFLSIFGFLNLTKEMIILNYPFTESYINYFYEVFEIIKISLAQFIN